MSKSAAFLILSTLISAPTAFADMDIPVNKVTAYSGGHCKFDPNGGGDLTATQEPVREHTVENPKGGLAFAAVPQHGKGAAGIFKCYFHDEKNFPGIRFKAADHYKANSNGMQKYDASHDCFKGLDDLTMPATSIVVEGNCGGVQGGAGDEIQRTHRHSRRHGKKKG